MTNENDVFTMNDDTYDVNEQMNRWAFPGTTWIFDGRNEREVPVNGMTKREFFALSFACSLTKEYVNKPLPAVIEMISSTAIKQADDLIKALKNNHHA